MTKIHMRSNYPKAGTNNVRKIPLKDKKWVSSIGLRKRHLWRQNSNSNLNVGINNKLLPAIWNFLPTKSVQCKTGLFWPDWWKIHQRSIFYSDQLWLMTYCSSLTATNFLAHFFCSPRLQVVLYLGTSESLKIWHHIFLRHPLRPYMIPTLY